MVTNETAVNPFFSVEAAQELLSRAEAAWPNPPVFIGGVLHRNGADVKDYLREAILHRPEFLTDAIDNARNALGDCCFECGDEIGNLGSGEPRCCSRECADVCWRDE